MFNCLIVIDKKKFLHVFKNKNVNDLLICLFQEGVENITSIEFDTNYHNYIKYNQSLFLLLNCFPSRSGENMRFCNKWK